ncbi:MAG: hypothetical protein IH591_06665 [Bacteroidales bacterium]|nr:hypothetical protein [Bacteroidales bacterium]
MKVLIICEAKDNYEKYFLTSIYGILRNRNHLVSVISKKEIATTNVSDFSIILIYSLLPSGYFFRVINNLHIPKILICEESNLYKFSNYDLSIFNKILIIKDTNGRKWNNYLPDSAIEYLNIPFITNENKALRENRNIKKILVAFRGNYQKELLVRVAPVLNSLSHHDIFVTGNRKFVQKILDINITPISWSKLEESIKDSDLVIGNGFIIMLSILSGKPAIVVGEYGLGGLINHEKIKKQYDCSFSGRIGGEFGELIPPRLLSDDILTVSEMGNEELNLLVKQNMDFFILQQVSCDNGYNGIIDKIFNDYSRVRNDLLNCGLIVSRDFSFSQFKSGEYLVSVTCLNHAIGVIDENEFKLIHQFTTSTKVYEAIAKSDSKNNESKYKETLLDLINDKLLTVI